MSNGLRLFLIAGCALVVSLELPSAVPTVRAGFHGPYPEVAATPAPVEVEVEVAVEAPTLDTNLVPPVLPVALPTSPLLAVAFRR